MTQLLCYSNAVQKHREKRSLKNKRNIDFDDECNCLPTCVNVEYEAELSELQYTNGNLDSK